MKTSRIGIHLLSTLLMFLWGGVLLYFYSSGRLVKGQYLSTDGWFIPMVLFAGIGLIVVGLFNLATMGAQEAGCGHDHGPDCGHDDDHKHDDSCGHDHHEVEHDHANCGHDHGHSHEHSHDHAHDHEGHGHGVLNESGPLVRFLAVFILIVPVTYAALKSPDQYSANAVINKGVYSANYAETARSDQFSLKKEEGKTPAKMAEPTLVANTPAPKPAVAPPAATDPKMADPQTKGAQTKSYGTFTLADLEAQVPRNKDGNFMLEVPEIYYTAGDKEVQGVLKGQNVETIAQVLPEKVNNEKGSRVRIFRLLIQCCAADARPFSIPVEFGKTPPKFKDMTWVKVTGTMDYAQENNQTVPVIKATSMTESAEPDSKAVY